MAHASVVPLHPQADQELLALLEEVNALRAAVAEDGAAICQEMLKEAGDKAGPWPGLANLGHYIALRRHDMRGLQRRLMPYGLSSLGRLEGRVMPTLDAVAVALAALVGQPQPVTPPEPAAFFAGETALAAATDRLLGPPRSHRRSRIMVTLPSEAADDPELSLELVRRGMDVARINCAHDARPAWERMATHVRAAGAVHGRSVSVLMDIAGPKIRLEAVAAQSRKARLFLGSRFRLVASGTPMPPLDLPFTALVSLPELVTRLRPGDRVLYNDGKVEGVVETVEPGEAILRVTRVKSTGSRLKPEKGLNLPDTALGLSPLTGKDETDLAAVLELADILGYSFVADPSDLDLLEEAVARHGRPERPLGLIAKIERPEAVRNLPALIARAAGRWPFGLMIARGDLAAEIGFERLAEMQEEILWLGEAASIPVIWATQVLESMVKEGTPSRGEMTDAAMAARAECVMLNKGPELAGAVALLDRLLGRMDAHQFKKTAMLRALNAW
ncbi:pyruvate kinase [Geminicoccus flavidas]|uniref:pyruvate kinase n=1 Tax=Geminicoccus flavidas TaxID=2506407 RepID=UPI001358816E|nr:pyruvate kinase [Geminicoccus flavidas]